MKFVYLQQLWLEINDYVMNAVLSEAILGGGSTPANAPSTAPAPAPAPPPAVPVSPTSPNPKPLPEHRRGPAGVPPSQTPHPLPAFVNSQGEPTLVPQPFTHRRCIKLELSSPRLILPVHQFRWGGVWVGVSSALKSTSECKTDRGSRQQARLLAQSYPGRRRLLSPHSPSSMPSPLV